MKMKRLESHYSEPSHSKLDDSSSENLDFSIVADGTHITNIFDTALWLAELACKSRRESGFIPTPPGHHLTFPLSQRLLQAHSHFLDDAPGQN